MKKTALITGGLGGIGTAICRRLHDDGHTVAATFTRDGGRLEKWRLAQKTDGYDGFHLHRCDITEWDECARLKETVEKELGGVDILVNNAGITRDATFLKMTPEMWREVLRTNLDGAFYVSKQFVGEMAQRGFGRVINISSVNGQKGQFGQSNYSAAKAGMHGFTKALAQEMAKKGVTVNTISPGYIGTEMVKKIAEEIQDKIRAQIPVGRFGEPSEIAATVSFLASESAAFITGANLSVNGGQHMF